MYSEHPEDRADRLDSEIHAEKLYEQFCMEYAEDIKSLIRSYSDNDAEELLEKLREDFWSGAWERRKKREAKNGKAITRRD